MRNVIKIIILTFILFSLNINSTQAYTVKYGDTMWKIAQKHFMNYSDLVRINPHIHNPSAISPGQHINTRSGQLANQIIEYARSLQDETQYKLGAKYYKAPYLADCSSWTKHIYSVFGIELPRVSWKQAHVGKPVRFENIKKGDLLFYGERGRVSHVGIYIGDGLWISNLNSERDVVILSVWGSWSYQRFLWAQRVLP